MNKSDFKILDIFRRDTFTTDMVDEFMEEDYDLLALGTYTFATAKYDREKVPNTFMVKFFIPKVIGYDDVDPDWDYSFADLITMTEMKELTKVPFIYDPNDPNMSPITVSLQDTLDEHIEEMCEKRRIFVRLKRPFGIKAQNNHDYYYRGFGRHHTFPVTRVEIKDLMAPISYGF